jgi:hypothetical protein
MAATASLKEQSLQAARIPGPDFPHGSQGVQFCGTDAHSGASRQWKFWGPISHTTSGNLVSWRGCRLRRTEPGGSGCSMAWFSTQASGRTVLWDCCTLRRTEPVGSWSFGAQFPHGLLEAVPWCCCLLRRIKPACIWSSRAQSPIWASGSSVLWHCCLVPSVTQQAAELWDLFTQGSCFPWSFRVKVAGCVLGGAWSSEFLCVLGSRTYHGVMEPWAVWLCQRWRIRSIELQVGHSSHG